MKDLTSRNRESCSDDPTGTYSETNPGLTHHQRSEQVIKDSQHHATSCKHAWWCWTCATLKIQQVVNTVEVKTLKISQEDDARREREFIQTTINLVKINQTCLIEILQFSAQQKQITRVSKITQQVSNTQGPAEEIVYLKTRSSSEPV